MKTITKYHKQNTIQKSINSYLNMFKIDYNRVRILENKGLRIYTPKKNKIKLGVMCGLIIGVVITPFTPEFIFIPKLIKWGLK